MAAVGRASATSATLTAIFAEVGVSGISADFATFHQAVVLAALKSKLVDWHGKQPGDTNWIYPVERIEMGRAPCAEAAFCLGYLMKTEEKILKFIAVDVETANADMASICSVGAAVFEYGRLSDEWYTLVDPDDYFDPVNVSIDGIDQSTVAGSPGFRDVASTIDRLVGGAVVVTHTHFDRVAMHQAAHRCALEPLRCNWLDSARMARRAWADCARSGYGLADVCRRIGYKFQRHNALEDAKAAGHVLLAAMAEMGLDFEGVLRRGRQPIDLSSATSGRAARDGNPDGPLFGEVLVFTGTLEMPRREAADLAASVGCEVTPGVTKKTTLLVVGDIDVQRLAGHAKSSKHRKAEELIAQGFPIRIVRETDFLELVAMA